MGAGFPLGAFARGRRDWSLPQLMLASGQNGGQGNATMRFSLVNNSNAGHYLAVYGILGWRGAYPPLMAALVEVGTDTALPTGYAPLTAALVTGMPALDGYIGGTALAHRNVNNSGLTFRADGTHWLTMGDLPMFVFGPGYRLSVYAQGFGNDLPAYDPVACSFVWGYYEGVKPPKG